MTCQQCGTENPGTNRFCMKCGAELATPAAAGGETPANQTSQRTYAGNYTPSPASNMGWQSTASSGSSGTAYTQSQLVGFGPRFLGFLVDWIVLVVVGAILNFIHLTWIVELVNIGYFVYFWSTTGQTIGDTVMKIKVVRTDGQPLSWSTGIIRYVGVVISVVCLFIGLLWVLWDPNKQGWHDKIANTYVVTA